MVIFAIFFTLGVWLLQQQSELPDFAFAWLLLAFPFALLRGGSRIAGFFRMLLLAACACGAGFYHAAFMAQQRLSVSLPDEWQGRDIEVTGVVAELPRQHPQGLRFVFDVEQTATPLAFVPEHVYLSTYSDRHSRPLDLKAGERWQLTLRLKQPHGAANPHGFDFELWALERNIRAVGYVRDSEKAGHPKGYNRRSDEAASGYLIEKWREKVRYRFEDILGDAPYAGVLIALAIGDQNSILAPQWQIFTRTGVNHLMSISGLHITMLASMAFVIAYWLWRQSRYLTLRLPARKAAALAAIMTALGYALLSGFAVPAQRTVYMVGAIAAALWLNRNFSPWQILAAALTGVLIPDPWAVMSAGFWLSFGAVALIMHATSCRIGNRTLDHEVHYCEIHASVRLLPRPLGEVWGEGNGHGEFHHPGWLSRHARYSWLREYASVQWAITIGLMPLLLGLFQQVSLVAPLANAVAIPLISLVVVPLALLGAALPLDAPLWLAHIVMDAVMLFLEWLDSMPHAVWAQHAPPPWSMVAGMLGVLLILLPRGFPARWLGFLLLLPMFLNKPQLPAEGALNLTVFDVGQGLAVAAQTRGHAMLYDTGGDFSGDADSGNRILIPALRALGIAELDGLIISHDDIDHTGGTASIIGAMPVGWIMSSSASIKGSLAPDANRRCRDGMNWDWDGVRFELLHPPGSDAKKSHDNDQSCVLRIGSGRQSILIAGDIEKDSEMRLVRQHSDRLSANLLIVPHHGSRHSSSIEFVAATLPDHAVFTSGYRNRFGHPHAEVLQRYEDSGAKLLRSDKDGAIIVKMDAQGLQVERYRKTHGRYWTH